MIARGRLGAFLAGLGFMLPGFVLMFALSWFYVSYGINSPIFQSVFLGMQPAVAALIVRAVHRIGSHALHNNTWLWGIAIFAGASQLLGVNFLIPLLIGGFIYALAARGQTRLALTFGLLAALLTFFYAVNFSSPFTASTESVNIRAITIPDLFVSGLRAGLLTFGGAYTAIPFIQRDAVEVGAWMTNAQFLDGLALSGLLPAPLIIFSTFVGYLGGGALGAVVITIGVFAPAFAFTMIGHDYLEKLVENKSAHAFLDGVTAGVVGLIAVTAIDLLLKTVNTPIAFLICAISLLALFLSKSKWITAIVVLAAGVVGVLLF
jgi:chromate transporter